MGGSAAFPRRIAAALAARERRTIDDASLVEACVLVPLLAGPADEPRVILTRRRETLAAHAGQVSFPGGVREPRDATPLATALRETEEELGIPASRVAPLGALDDVWVVTGYRITPFVGWLAPGTELRPNPEEVARAFDVSLAELVDPARTAFRLERMTRGGRTLDVPFFEHDGELIWGATGRALLGLLEVALGFVAPPAVPGPARSGA